MRAATRLARIVLLAGVAVAVATPAFGLFGSSATSPTGTFSTAELTPPANLAVAWSCPGRKLDYTATITWTASTSTFATSYEVAAAPSASGPWTVILITTDTTATETGIPHKTNRWYSVTAMAQAWRSTPAVIAAKAPTPEC